MSERKHARDRRNADRDIGVAESVQETTGNAISTTLRSLSNNGEARILLVGAGQLSEPPVRNKTSTPIFLSAMTLACLAAMDAKAQAVQAAAPPASAASSAATSPDSRSMTLAPVVITAQKRTENARQVPLSVSVLSGDAIQQDHIDNLADLTRAIPNLSYSTQAGAGLATLEVRGVSSQAGSATVSIYLDDVSLTTRNLYSEGSAEPRFFDIDRVEILRGPQGTLYGASSLGGTIKFISNQPDARSFSGSVNTELSSTSHGGTNYMGQAVLNVPLVKDDIALLRIGVQTGHDSGYIDQVSPTTLNVVDKGINGTHWDVLKLALKAKLGNNWSITPSLFYQHFKSDDIDASYQTVGAYQLPADATPPTLPRFQTSKTVREPSTDALTIPSVTLNGDVGFADFTGVLSGYTRRFERIQDGTNVNVPYVASQVTDPTLAGVVGGLPSAVQLDNRIDQTSLEMRLASKAYDPSRGPLTWVGGVYLNQTKTQVIDNEPIFGINAAFTAADANINDPNQLAGTFPGAFTGDSSYYSARHYKDRQYAAFGELTYNVDPTLRATVGLRALRATEAFTREGNYYYAGGESTAAIDSSDHALTPRVAASWDVTRDSSVYTNIAKGFRLGSANRPVPDTPPVEQDLATLGLPSTVPAAFKSDSLWSYELGSKSRFLDNRLSITGAIFHIDWKNIQQDVVLPVSGYDFETNVGNAKINGFELEGRFRATEGLTLSLGGSYSHAVFAEDTPALGTADDGGLNVRKGDPIQGVPKYNARLGFDYRFAPMSFGDVYVRGAGQWTGSSHGSFIRSSSDYLRPAYFTADASTGVALDKWEFSLFVKNLTNNHTVLQRPSVQFLDENYTLRPRTIGVTGQYTF